MVTSVEAKHFNPALRRDRKRRKQRHHHGGPRGLAAWTMVITGQPVISNPSRDV